MEVLYRFYCNSKNTYAMACSPVCGDYPLALASGLSYAQVKIHDISIFYNISVDLVHYEIIRTEFGEGDIKRNKLHISTFLFFIKIILFLVRTFKSSLETSVQY